MAIASLTPLHNHAVLFATLQQEALEQRLAELGEYGWGADALEGTVTFTSKADPARHIAADAEVIASIAPGPRSMVWGWSIPQGRPDGFAAQVRAYGAQYGVAELTASEVPFPGDVTENLGAYALELAHQIGAVTAAVTGRGPYFAASVGGGSQALFLLTLNPPLPQLTIAAAVPALPRLLSGVALSDPRGAIVGLAALARWTLTWADEQYLEATLNDGTSTATVSFDQQGRITNIAGTLSGQS